MLRQKFIVQVTTLPDCDDITPYDGTLCDGFFVCLMSAHLVILGRVIPSSPPLDMKQFRYTNFYKSDPLILNYHEKVSGYGPQ